MICRHDLLKIEAIEQLPLIPIKPSHHRPILKYLRQRDGITIRSSLQNHFCNKIGPNAKFQEAPTSPEIEALETRYARYEFFSA
jgi:hypothetical protein